MLANFAAITLVLRYLGKLTITQSLIFALLFAAITNLHVGRGEPKQLFRVFRITFYPKFADMFQSIGWLEKTDDWRVSLADRVLEHPDDSNDPEKLGFSCDVLTVATEHSEQLLYWSPMNCFTSTYRMNFDLRPRKSDTIRWSYCQFFMDFHREDADELVIAFGIRMPKTEWLNVKAPELVNAKSISVKEISGAHFMPDYVDIIFGIFPDRAVTRPFYNMYPYSTPARNTERRLLTAKELEKTGWQADKCGVLHHNFMVIQVEHGDETVWNQRRLIQPWMYEN